MSASFNRPSSKTLPAALAMCLVACSPETASAPGAAQPTKNGPPAATPAPPPAPAAASPSVPAEGPPPANILTSSGLGTLKVGQPIPAGSTWSERGAQIPGPCRTISSPAFPGVCGTAEKGEVRRITVGGQSTVKLINGIGTGASEAEVRAAFPRFREEPHKYVESPAKYFTAPNTMAGDPALRFEIGRDGKVSLIHAGTMPVLGYVEGCA